MSRASYLRQLSLIVTDGLRSGVRIRVEEWDIPNSSYPDWRYSKTLNGVLFPDTSDALDVLQKGLDKVRVDGLRW